MLYRNQRIIDVEQYIQRLQAKIAPTPMATNGVSKYHQAKIQRVDLDNSNGKCEWSTCLQLLK